MEFGEHPHSPELRLTDARVYVKDGKSFVNVERPHTEHPIRCIAWYHDSHGKLLNDQICHTSFARVADGQNDRIPVRRTRETQRNSKQSCRFEAVS